jgi:hypothetical protein
LTVIFPDPTDVIITKGKMAPPRILAKIIELDSLGCKYEVGAGAWKIAEEMIKLGKLKDSFWDENLRATVALPDDMTKQWTHGRDI